MYVPEWFVALSIFLCVFTCIGLLTLLSMWISSIVSFVEECRSNFERVKYHGERITELEKQLKRCSRR